MERKIWVSSHGDWTRDTLQFGIAVGTNSVGGKENTLGVPCGDGEVVVLPLDGILWLRPG